MIRDIVSLVWQSVKNIYSNKYRFILTSILLQLFLMTAGRFGLATLFRFAIELSGETSLTKDNLLVILGQTGPFLLLVAYLLALAGLIYLEMVCLVYMVTSSHRHYEFRDFIRAGWHQLLWLSGPQILVFFLYVILMVPIGNLGLSSTLLGRLQIPTFIVDELSKTGWGNVVLYGFMAIVVYLNLRLIYFLPLAVLNNDTPLQNIRQSWRLTRHHLLKLILSVGTLSVGLTGLGVLISFLLSLLFGYIDDIWDNLALQTLFYSLVRGLLYLITFLNKLVLIEVLVNHLLKYDEEHQDIRFVTLSESDAKPFRYPKWSKGLLFATLLGGMIYNGVQLYLVSMNPNVLMIAHRGDIAKGVENSIEALEGAAESGADLVEMDVVMTADQELVVIHDNDLGRLAGRDWEVTDMTLAELEGLEIRQDRFKSKIVSFETYFKKAKELDQPLLIELKLYGTEPDDYVDKVLKAFEGVGLRASDKVMSLDLEVMEAIEKQAPDLQTGYVIPLQFGDISGFETDFYVLEDTSYTEWTMWQAEQQGKDVYIWTVNDAETMSNYLQSPVNGIITDKLALFKSEQDDLQSDDGYFARALRLLALQD